MREIIHIHIGSRGTSFSEMLEMYSTFQFKRKLFHQVQQEEGPSQFTDLLIVCTRSDLDDSYEDIDEKKRKQHKKLMEKEIYRFGGLSDVIIDVPNRNYEFVRENTQWENRKTIRKL